MAAALAAANVDSMWRAAIKRNYVVPAEFTYANAWRDALARKDEALSKADSRFQQDRAFIEKEKEALSKLEVNSPE